MAKILLVEDDAPLLRLYENTLSEDYQVASCGSASEAIKLFDETRPDLVVLDLNLPDAPGTRIIDYVDARQDIPHTRIIVMTGFANKYRRESFPPLVVEVLNKPVTPTMLKRVCSAAIASAIGL